MAEGKVVIQIIGRDKTGIATSKASRNFKNLSKSIRQSGLAQIATIGAASLAISKGISTLASFDTKIREISTLLDDVSEESIQDMGQEIETLAIDFGQSIDVMAKARYDAISAGFTNIADSAELLAVASKLAVGGVASVAQTTDVLTSVLNSYGKGAEQAEHFSDLLFTTVRLGKTTITELSGSIGRASAIAPQLGIKFEELSAAIAALTASGQSTDQVVTSLQAAMTSLLKPSEAMQSAIEGMGFESAVSAIKVDGFTETFRKLTEGVSEMELAARFPNVRAMKAVFPLLGTAADKFAQSLAEMGLASGATEKAFGKMADGIGFRIEQMKARSETVFLRIGEVMAPLAETGVDVAEGFTDLDATTQRMIISTGAFVGILAALRPVLISAGKALAGIAGTTFGVVLLGLGALWASFELIGASVNKVDQESLDFIATMNKFNVKTAGKDIDALNKDLETMEDRLVSSGLGIVDLKQKLALLGGGEEDIGEKISLQIRIDLAEDFAAQLQTQRDKIQSEIDALEAISPPPVAVEGVKLSAESLNEIINLSVQKYDLLEKASQQAATGQIQAAVETAAKLTGINQQLNAQLSALSEKDREVVEKLAEAKLQVLTDAADEEIKLAEDAAEKKARVDEQSQALLTDLRREFLMTDREAQREAFIEELEAIDENWERKAETQDIWLAFLKRQRQEELTNTLTEIQNFGQQLFSQFSILERTASRNARNENNKKLADEKKFFDAKKQALIKHNTVNGQLTEKGKLALEQLEQNHEGKMTRIREFGVEEQKRIASNFKFVKVAQAISNIALGVTQALAAAPPPFNLVLAAITAAAGAVQLTAIKAQPFQTGGVVGGNNTTIFSPTQTDVVPDQPIDSFGQSRINSPVLNSILSGESAGRNVAIFTPSGTDTVPAMLTPGERVFSVEQSKQNEKLFSFISAGGNVEKIFKSETFQTGGIVGGDNSTVVDSTLIEDNATNESREPVILNLSIITNISAIDSQSVEDVIRSEKFLTPISDAINEALLDLRAGEVRIEAKK